MNNKKKNAQGRERSLEEEDPHQIGDSDGSNVQSHLPNDASSTSTQQSVSPAIKKQCQGGLHGSLPRTKLPQDVEGIKRAQVLEELLQTIQFTMAQGIPFTVTLVNFVKEPVVSQQVLDEHLVSLVLAVATDHVLEGNVPLARFLVSLARALAACLAAGTEEFCRVVAAASTNQPVSPAPAWYCTWNAETIDICNDNDVILYLANHIPCHCLESQAAKARLEPSLKSCHGCSTIEQASQTFFVCAKCRIVKYCSRDCQVKHWKEHKIFCKSVARVQN